MLLNNTNEKTKGRQEFSNLRKCQSQESNSGSLILDSLLLAIYYTTFYWILSKTSLAWLMRSWVKYWAKFYYWAVFLPTKHKIIGSTTFFPLYCSFVINSPNRLLFFGQVLCSSSSTQLTWLAFSGLFPRAVIPALRIAGNPDLASGTEALQLLQEDLLLEFRSIYTNTLFIMLVLHFHLDIVLCIYNFSSKEL